MRLNRWGSFGFFAVSSMIAACGSDVNGGGGSGGNGGSGGGGAPTPCGNLMCTETEFCDWTDDACGQSGGTGTCKPRPMACNAIYAPVCNCNGVVSSSDCNANGEGYDIDTEGACAPPTPDLFLCGAGFCLVGKEYCERTISDVGGFPDGTMCKPLPAGCMNCACLMNVPCGMTCNDVASGGSIVTCPGG